MTTIAYDGETLAADSQLTGSHIEQTKTKKILKTNDGHLVAFAGSPAGAYTFFAWFNTSRSPKDFPELYGNSDHEFECLVIGPDGEAHLFANSPMPLELTPPTAIGSGSTAAVAAMLAGADAKNAIRIASKLDPHTGGPIRTAKPKNKKKKKA